jgi:hypothetical protein
VRQFAFSFELAKTLLRVGAWLLPWLVVLVLSCGLAYAADLQLVQAWSPAPSSLTTSSRATSGFTPGGGQWVSIEAVTEDGSRYDMECLAKPGTFTTREVVLEVSELHAIAAESCDQLQAIQQH